MGRLAAASESGNAAVWTISCATATQAVHCKNSEACDTVLIYECLSIGEARFNA
jgi:hypothetical protein